MANITIDGVAYEVLSSKMEGNNWELTLLAFTEEVNKIVQFRKTRSITEDGKTYEKDYLMRTATKLPDGQKIQIKLDMGPLPASVSKIARVELDDISVKKGSKSMVLKNVKVDR